MQEQRDLLRERRKFLRGYSVFRFFWCQADFEEDAQFFSCVEFTASAIEALRKRQIIHRIDSMKQSGCAGGFVALQMPDQMPSGGQVSHGSALPFPLLHAIFAEMPQPGGVRHADGLGRVRLRYGNQRDFFGAASGLLRRSRYALLPY